jgi:hypothetical protein
MNKFLARVCINKRERKANSSFNFTIEVLKISSCDSILIFIRHLKLNINSRFAIEVFAAIYEHIVFQYSSETH